MIKEDDIRDAIEHIVAGVALGADRRFEQIVSKPDVQAALQHVTSGDCDAFHMALIRPLDQFVESAIASVLGKNHAARFLFQHSAFVERQFRRVIEDREGTACCADKSRSVMRSLARYLLTGKPIVLDRNQQYTYHLPTTVFTTHEAIVAFFEAVHHLYYGHAECFIAIKGALSG